MTERREEGNSLPQRKRNAGGRALLIAFAVIGAVALGLVGGALIRAVPGMVAAGRVRRLLRGAVPVPDFTITLPDGTGTSFSRECSLADDVVLSFVSTGCGQCREEMHALSSGLSGPGLRKIRYLPITSEPQSMILAYGKSAKDTVVIGHVSDALFRTFGIEEVPQLVVVNQNRHVIGHMEGFDASTIPTLRKIVATDH